MIFTGKNLELVLEALSLAVDDIHNSIATCPDVVEYADELQELYKKQTLIIRLYDRVNSKFEVKE
jgi:hypothetical protein